MTESTTSYATLSPDLVLDALDTLGLYSDGRLLALNSYENRVYQIGMEDGPPVVVKFYRPHRWSDAQILEEHAFVDELAEREIPVVPASRIGGATLHHQGGFAFGVFPRLGGRAP
jgi:Ser/Thr protein kinase RdoA (MazF antagonist)